MSSGKHQPSGRPSRREIHAREVMFLSLLFDDDGPYFGKRIEAGLEAGFSQKSVDQGTQEVLTRYGKKSFRECCEVFGLNKVYLAKKFSDVMKHEKTKPETVIQLGRLLLSNFGEKTADTGTTNVNVEMPRLLVMGIDQKKLRALVTGGNGALPEPAIPQLPEGDENNG